MYDAANLRITAIQCQMGWCIRGGFFTAFDHQTGGNVHHHHILRRHHVVLHAGRLDDHHAAFAISISLSTSRMKQVGEKNLLKPLRETAEAISKELGFNVREG
ncbi:HTH-type transcriptional regulator yiaJ [Enterobacter bugandensis]|nr:HTH-type transcriptional regulator yiaJ [Enterobacter bugandensis]